MKNVKDKILAGACLLVAVAALVAAGFVFTGCATKLDPAGVYGAQANGAALYAADLTITTGYNEMDSFVTWETQNHTYLASKFPAVVNEADSIRTNGPKWIATATALRDAYAANSTVANSNAMATALAVITTAANQSTNYMTTPVLTDIAKP